MLYAHHSIMNEWSEIYKTQHQLVETDDLSRPHTNVVPHSFAQHSGEYCWIEKHAMTHILPYGFHLGPWPAWAVWNDIYELYFHYLMTLQIFCTAAKARVEFLEFISTAQCSLIFYRVESMSQMFLYDCNLVNFIQGIFQGRFVCSLLGAILSSDRILSAAA